ncbi:DUF3325 domain-containing protein [Ferrimonas sp. SCSIO 43195]|uniref:DUF3325 domain-containing protein n=1 Tax=Ferrimonas sp. SCSIO 43195 TaxID=2822844 RepID=UPI00207522AD|nr:DUF3325 domain-containing protein [Ferrimonas sp. SCSIO 43195]
MISLSLFLLMFIAVSALALAMPKHHRQLGWRWSLTPRRQRALRVVATAALGLTLAGLTSVYSVGIGLTLFMGLLAIAIKAVALLLSFGPPRGRST